jgi:hypothetical protein
MPSARRDISLVAITDKQFERMQVFWGKIRKTQPAASRDSPSGRKLYIVLLYTYAIVAPGNVRDGELAARRYLTQAAWQSENRTHR